MSSKFNCIAWDEWSEWSKCDVDCGGGSRRRSRDCNLGNPGEIGCHLGGTSESDVCNEQECAGLSNCYVELLIKFRLTAHNKDFYIRKPEYNM